MTAAASPDSTSREIADGGIDELLTTVASGAASRDLYRIHPYEQVNLIKAAGLGAARVPVGLGGRGWSLRELLSFVVRLGAADPNVAHAFRNHYAFVEGRLRTAADPVSRRWLREITSGALFGSAATELGSSKVGAQQFKTTLRPDGSAYRLNGIKYYSTGTLYADWISIPAVTDDGSLATVVVPGDRPGVHRDDDWDGIGQRLTGTGTTRLENVRIEAAEILSIRSPDAPRPRYQGGLSQLFLTAIIAGILHDAAGDAKGLVRGRRRTFAHAPADSPADDPLLQAIVGQIESSAYAAEATVLAAADALDRQVQEPSDESAHEAALQVSKAKVAVDQLGMQAAGLIFDVGGASATERSRGLDRHWRNIRTLASHNPAAYKARAIGAHAINGTELPESGFF